MASDFDTCENDPNFAVICAFLEKFGAQCGIANVDFFQLQIMLENSNEVPKELHEILLKLLRKTRSSVSAERWEKALVKVIGTCNIQDAWEVERFGYKKAKLSSKIRILKDLLEMQFDHHVKFKSEINKIPSSELRSQPLGRDKFGHAYWYLSDNNFQIRVYKEDLDDERWTLVAKDRPGLIKLINELCNGETKFSSDSPGNEDSNSLSEKIIFDTGQVVEGKPAIKKNSKIENHLKCNDGNKLSNAPDNDEECYTDVTNKVFNREEPIVVLEKLPKSRVKIYPDTNVLSSPIEEPVLHVKGEGTGEDNNSVFNHIIGYEIQEQVQYFFGPGQGASCQTGNIKDGDKVDNGNNDEPSETNKKEFEKGTSQTLHFFFGSSGSQNKDIQPPSLTMEFGSSKNTEVDVKKKQSQQDIQINANDTESLCSDNVSIKNTENNMSENGRIYKQSETDRKSCMKTQRSEENLSEGIDSEVVSDKTKNKESGEKTAFTDDTSKLNYRIEKPCEHTSLSSIANSPESTIESVVSIECAEANSGLSIDSIILLEKDPLAVSDEESHKSGEHLQDKIFKEVEKKTENNSVESKKKQEPTLDSHKYMKKTNCVSSVSVKTIPTVPSSSFSRKRTRNVNGTTSQEVIACKVPKNKCRKHSDNKLRKSVEEKKNQQVSSSDDSEIVQKFTTKENTKTKQNSNNDADSRKTSKKCSPLRKKGSRILANLGIDNTQVEIVGVRASRRIAQMKIKEQVDSKRNELNRDLKQNKKKGSSEDKDFKLENRKRGKDDKEDNLSDLEVLVDKKKKKKEKAPSKIFNENKPWQSSSESSEDDPQGSEEEEEYEEEEFKDPESDHEFSPESDISDEDWQPLKRARTARKEDQEVEDECACQKCGKFDHPEWILLCDKCNNGWHCSCLRPPLLEIPEGDWYCPPCQHLKLLENLQNKLSEYDKILSKKQLEDRRKERLAYVGISLNNVLPNKGLERKRRRHSLDNGQNSRESSYDSESNSDSDEPIYQLRQRRNAKSYKFSEYDEMIKSALGDDIDEPEKKEKTYGRGKDINTIINAEKEEKLTAEWETDEKTIAPEAKEICKIPSVTSDSKIRNPVVSKGITRRKPRKLTGLDVSSEDDDYSDEDFKESNTSEESEEEYSDVAEETEDDSDEYVHRRKKGFRPIRRSTRMRTSRYDTDFINDDESNEKVETNKNNLSDSEYSSSSEYKKKKKRNKKNVGKKKLRIKYGGLTSSDEDLSVPRRTRGKKLSYFVDTPESDESCGQTKRNCKPIKSDEDDEDYVVQENDRDSEDNNEFQDEVEEFDKRPLCVPKIYIKRPPIVKNKAAGENKFENINSNILNKGLPDSVQKDCSEELRKNKFLPKKNTENHEQLQKIAAIDRELKNTIDEINKDFENPPDISEAENTASQIVIDQVETTKLINPNKLTHEPIFSNITVLKIDEDNDDLSEPPGISLPLLNTLGVNPKITSKMTNPTSIDQGLKPQKEKEERNQEETRDLTFQIGKDHKKVQIEVAAPPQPFVHTQPPPSVITRMLQNHTGMPTAFPVGTIRPKQFATMPDDDDDDSPPNRPSVNPSSSFPVSSARPVLAPYSPIKENIKSSNCKSYSLPSTQPGNYTEYPSGRSLPTQTEFDPPAVYGEHEEYSDNNQPGSYTKSYEDVETSGEFGGLVSYFSSQQDDLDS